MSGGQRCGFTIGVGILRKPDLSIHVKFYDAVGDEAQERASGISSAITLELMDEVQGRSGIGPNEVEDPLLRGHRPIMPYVTVTVQRATRARKTWNLMGALGTVLLG